MDIIEVVREDPVIFCVVDFKGTVGRDTIRVQRDTTKWAAHSGLTIGAG